MKQPVWKPLLALGLISMLGACAAPQSEKDLLLEAQFCMDKASATEVSGCVDKISHIRNEAASALRCAAGFIREGLTSPENLSQAIDALSDGNSDPITLLGVLKMSSDSVAEQTAAECNASKKSSYMLLGAMSRSSTKLGTVLGDASVDCKTLGLTPLQCSVANVQAGIDELVATNPANLTGPEIEAAITTIGDTVAMVYDTSCSGSGTKDDICKMIDDALADAGIATPTFTSTEEFGKALLDYWKSQQHP